MECKFIIYTPYYTLSLYQFTLLILGVFDLELPFSGSLGTQRHEGGTRRIVAVVVAIVVVEVEHACIRTIVIVAAAIEPSIAGIREVRAIRLNTYIT